MNKVSEAYFGLAIVLISLVYAVIISLYVPNAPWLLLYSSYAMPIISLAIFAAILNVSFMVLRFAFSSKGDKSPIRYLYTAFIRLSLVKIFQISWPVAVIVIVIPAFNVFKQGVLPSVGYEFDDLFSAIDTMIFGVASPGVWLVKYFNSPNISGFIDLVYHTWFFPMALGVILVAYSSSPALRLRYMLTFVLAWIVMATFMAYLLPAAGPFYAPLKGAGADDFTQLLNLLNEHQYKLGEISALAYQSYLFKAESSANFVMGGGISAMPSMHNAFALLFALGMWMYSKALGVVFLIYAFAIFIGSVYLGWHYAIDGLVAWLIVIMLWVFSGWIVRRALIQ